MKNVSPITGEMLSRMEARYDSHPEYAIMSNTLFRTKLDDAAFVPSGAAKLRMDFSINIPTTNITTQRQSGRCWMFSVMNLLRERVIKKCELSDFALSGAFLAFYDKLEKVNNFFEAILKYSDQELFDRETFSLMGKPLPDGGQWDMAVSLLRKYGVTPDWVMPEAEACFNTSMYMPILERKMREYGLELRNRKRSGQDVTARREEMLSDLYNALRILYGQPPKVFDFDYTDKNGVFHSYPDMTPQRFFEEFIGDDLDDYVMLTCSPIHEVNRTYCAPFTGDIVEDNITWLNLSQEEVEDITIRQLKGGEAVCFSCDCHPDRDRAHGYWDPDTFQYGQVLGGLTFNMTGAERLLTRDSNMNHCMLFCGVNIDKDGNPNRWKIENSWGAESGQKGYFIGSEKWFKRNVYQIIVRKEYLNPQQIDLFNQEPIAVPLWDPMA